MTSSIIGMLILLFGFSLSWDFAFNSNLFPLSRHYLIDIFWFKAIPKAFLIRMTNPISTRVWSMHLQKKIKTQDCVIITHENVWEGVYERERERCTGHTQTQALSQAQRERERERERERISITSSTKSTVPSGAFPNSYLVSTNMRPCFIATRCS